MEISIIKPTLADIARMQKLVADEVARGVILPRSDDEVANAIRSYFLAVDSNADFTAESTPHPSLRAVSEVAHQPSLRAAVATRGEAQQSPCADSGIAHQSSLRGASGANGVAIHSSNPSSASPLPNAIDCHASATRPLAMTDSAAPNTLLGYCALFVYSQNLAEIRSLIVHPKFRKIGVATKLLTSALAEARALGIKEVLTLTYKPQVFTPLGFEVIEKTSVPNHKIWADCVKCQKFPACDEIALLKTL